MEITVDPNKLILLLTKSKNALSAVKRMVVHQWSASVGLYNAAAASRNAWNLLFPFL